MDENWILEQKKKWATDAAEKRDWPEYLADAAYQQGQRDRDAELAAQCGPEPCGTCQDLQIPEVRENCAKWARQGGAGCRKLWEWDAQQAGYAKGLAESTEKAKAEGIALGVYKVLEFTLDLEKSYQEFKAKYGVELADLAWDESTVAVIEAWLTSQGITRPK